MAEMVASGPDTPTGARRTADLSTSCWSRSSPPAVTSGRSKRALEAMDFAPEGDGWRWRGRIENRVVKIEFLGDLDDQPAEALVTPSGCREPRAVNLRATGNVEHDHREIALDGPDGPVRVRIAALAGYLLSKAAAARSRGAEKDYYDVVYVLLHNHAGGPAAAAAVINASKLQTALAGMASTLIELRERFTNDRATGPRAFAQESLRSLPTLTPGCLRPTPPQPSTSSSTRSGRDRRHARWRAGLRSRMQAPGASSLRPGSDLGGDGRCGSGRSATMPL